MIPTPELLGNRIRIYLGFCDSKGISRIGNIEVSAENPQKVLSISSSPLLDIGRPGAFDDNGVVPTSIVTAPDGNKFLYYVGFELCKNIRYRLLSGIAKCSEDGKTFKRLQETPVLERSGKEMYFRCAPHVLRENNIFRLWYIAGNEWLKIDGKDLPIYTVKYLESNDGINWGTEGHPCLSLDLSQEHGFGRPYVIRQGNLYKMFYSIRKLNGGYCLGYAESPDGIDWKRMDNQIGLAPSDTGWDSKTICYSSVLEYGDRTYLFYNGNDFGKSGVGYAVLEH